MDMKSVFSSHISKVGYDPESKQLAVEFQTGKTAIYVDVPGDVAQSFLDSPSLGTALNTMIRDRYAFGYANKA